jgi:hypothetical protein
VAHVEPPAVVAFAVFPNVVSGGWVDFEVDRRPIAVDVTPQDACFTSGIGRHRSLLRSVVAAIEDQDAALLVVSSGFTNPAPA